MKKLFSKFLLIFVSLNLVLSSFYPLFYSPSEVYAQEDWCDLYGEGCPVPGALEAPSCTIVREYAECTSCNTSRVITEDSCGNYNIVASGRDDAACTDGCGGTPSSGSQAAETESAEVPQESEVTNDAQNWLDKEIKEAAEAEVEAEAGENTSRSSGDADIAGSIVGTVDSGVSNAENALNDLSQGTSDFAQTIPNTFTSYQNNQEQIKVSKKVMEAEALVEKYDRPAVQIDTSPSERLAALKERLGLPFETSREDVIVHLESLGVSTNADFSEFDLIFQDDCKNNPFQAGCSFGGLDLTKTPTINQSDINNALAEQGVTVYDTECQISPWLLKCQPKAVRDRLAEKSNIPNVPTSTNILNFASGGLVSMAGKEAEIQNDIDMLKELGKRAGIEQNENDTVNNVMLRIFTAETRSKLLNPQDFRMWVGSDESLQAVENSPYRYVTINGETVDMLDKLQAQRSFVQKSSEVNTEITNLNNEEAVAAIMILSTPVGGEVAHGAKVGIQVFGGVGKAIAAPVIERVAPVLRPVVEPAKKAANIVGKFAGDVMDDLGFASKAGVNAAKEGPALVLKEDLSQEAEQAVKKGVVSLADAVESKTAEPIFIGVSQKTPEGIMPQDLLPVVDSKKEAEALVETVGYATGKNELNRSVLYRNERQIDYLRNYIKVLPPEKPVEILNIGAAQGEEAINYVIAAKNAGKLSDASIDFVDIGSADKIGSQLSLGKNFMNQPKIPPTADVGSFELGADGTNYVTSDILDFLNTQKTTGNNYFETGVEQFLRENPDKKYQVVTFNNVAQYLGGEGGGYFNPLYGFEGDSTAFQAVILSVAEKVDDQGLLLTGISPGLSSNAAAGNMPGIFYKNLTENTNFMDVFEVVNSKQGIYRRKSMDPLVIKPSSTAAQDGGEVSTTVALSSAKNDALIEMTDGVVTGVETESAAAQQISPPFVQSKDQLIGGQALGLVDDVLRVIGMGGSQQGGPTQVQVASAPDSGALDAQTFEVLVKKNLIKQKLLTDGVVDFSYANQVMGMEILKPEVKTTSSGYVLTTGKTGTVEGRLDRGRYILTVNSLPGVDIQVPQMVDLTKNSSVIVPIKVKKGTGKVEKLSSIQGSLFDRLVGVAYADSSEKNVEQNKVKIAIVADGKDKILPWAGVNVELEKVDQEKVVSLNPGWNLVSLPALPGETLTASALLGQVASEDGYATTVSTLENGAWKSYVVRGNKDYSIPTDDFAIEPGKAYFVKALKPSKFTFTGQNFTEPVKLKLSSGWNAVGLPKASKDYQAASLLDAFNSQQSSADTLARWDSGLWDTFVKKNQEDYGNNFRVLSNEGYMLKIEKGGEFSP